MCKFESDLLSILDDTKQYKRNKDAALSSYIANRLLKSFNSYYSDIDNSFNYLKFKDSLKVLKGINKYGANR